MRMHQVVASIVTLALSASIAFAGGGTALTYQGRLLDAGEPANGLFDFEFSLWNAANGGNPIGVPQVLNNTPVTDGLFTVQIDFGANAFDNTDRWLEIVVDGTTLSPRQPITRAPYSIQTRGIFVDTDENVGIGTNSPIAKLNVQDDGAGTALRVTQPNGDGTAIIAEAFGSGRALSIFAITSNEAVRVDNVGTGKAATFIGDVEFTNGFVGVGRDTPITSSEVFGIHRDTSSFGGMYAATSDQLGEPFYGYSAGGDVDAFHYFDGDDDMWKLVVGGTPSMFVRTDGRVTFGPAPDKGIAHVTVNNDGNDNVVAMRIDHQGLGIALTIESDDVGLVVSGDGPSTTAQFSHTGEGLTARFFGDVLITGNLSKGSGSFTIDHPLDPENKYLSHSFVESPDMMNIYNGNVVTDDRGYAVVELPEWFDALNREFRYQLTVVDDSDSEAFVLAKVVQRVRDNRFVIRTNSPNVEVSWQVTGIRHDPYAEQHRIQVEQDKPADERGKFLHPEVYGQPAEAAVNYGSRPKLPGGAEKLASAELGRDTNLTGGSR